MYLLIEHNGTEDNNKIAQNLKEIAEDNFGATCEFVIGNSPEVILYNDEQKELIRLENSCADEELNYILNFINEEE